MPAPLSVIIPTLDAAPEVGGLLEQLMDGVAAGLVREVILSDGGSQDDIDELAEAVGAEFISGATGRGGQLKRGAGIARGDWFLVLHADSQLPPGWASIIQAAMADNRYAHVFRLRFAACGFSPWFVAGWANLRTRVFGLPYGDQGLLISRELYHAEGGYPDIPLMEDVALVRSLERRPQLLPACITTSAARYEEQGWFRRGARNLWTLMRYLAGGDPETLSKEYTERGG